MVRVDDSIAKIDHLVVVIVVLASEEQLSSHDHLLTSQCRAFGFSCVNAFSSCIIAWLCAALACAIAAASRLPVHEHVS